MKTYLSVDLGAGSGRVIAARYDGKTLAMEVVNRFDNTPYEFNGHLFWNLPSLLANIREGLRMARAKYGEIASVGVDTWGVDYGLLDKGGRLLGMPYIYRDMRNTPLNTQEVFDRVGKQRLYNTAGTQFMDFNTVFQLHAEQNEPGSLLDKAERLLFMPDLVNYALCGVAANEATIASTSGLIDLGTRDWSESILDLLGIRRSLFGTPVQPGTVLGNVKGIPGLENTPVVAVGAHDTASAVASVPADPSTSWGYLATGTWALLGVEIPKPILTDDSYELNYTHEGAANGKIRYLKNCMGMWMVQELRRAWTVNGKAPGYQEMMEEAEAAEPFRSMLDPDYPQFQMPGRMPEKIAEFCRLTNQPVPETHGQFYRAAIEAIVMRYREVWGELARLTGTQRSVLHMIGGATQDAMHCQMTADALNSRILCGPIEGASMGNAVAQMVGLGDLPDFDAGRRLIRDSIELTVWEPKSPERWDAAYPRWLACKMLAKGTL